MRNGGKWTESRFNSFVRSALRQAWMKWPPNHQTKKDARVEKGKYRCAGWKRKSHIVPVTKLVDGKERMLCEQDNLQLLCRECHDRKTKEEKL